MTTTPTDPGAIDLEEIKTCHLEGSRGQWSSEADKYRREFFTKHGPTLIAEVEALRARLTKLLATKVLENKLCPHCGKNIVHLGWRYTAEESAAVEALRERVVELAGALIDLVQRLDGHFGGPQRSGDWKEQKTARIILAATPAEALERARAKDEIVDWVREIVAAGDVVGPRALAKLDALGKERG